MVIIQPIMDGIKFWRYLQKRIDILLGTTISKFSKTNKQINPQLQTVIIQPIMDGIQFVMCLQKRINIYLRGLMGPPKGPKGHPKKT